MAVIVTSDTSSLVTGLIEKLIGADSSIYKSVSTTVATIYATGAAYAEDDLPSGAIVTDTRLTTAVTESDGLDNTTTTTKVSGESLVNGAEPVFSSYAQSMSSRGISGPYSTSKDTGKYSLVAGIDYHPIQDLSEISLNSTKYKESYIQYIDTDSANPLKKTSTAESWSLKADVSATYSLGNVTYLGTVNSVSNESSSDQKARLDPDYFGFGYQEAVKFSMSSKDGLAVTNTTLHGVINSINYSNLSTDYSLDESFVIVTKSVDTYKSTDANALLAQVLSDYVAGDATAEDVAAALLLGNDKITGSAIADNLSGYGGNDNIKGGKGDDVIDGGSGKDTLDGGDGDDELSGGSGNDKLLGGNGNDSLHGGAGNDIFTGGKGADDFYIDGTVDGAGFDIITDFSSNTLDEEGELVSDRLIVLGKAGSDNTFDENDFDVGTSPDPAIKGVVISFTNGGGSVLLKGISLENLTFTPGGSSGVFAIHEPAATFDADGNLFVYVYN